MPETYDCIVLGVGGFGSGALYHLARRGLHVLGLDRFGIAHDRGSSHGETRIIRKAYFEHPDYVPLLLRAYQLWYELQQESGQRLCRLCGLLLAGPPRGEAIGGARRAALEHKLKIEELTAAQAAKRFKGFAIPDGFDILFEPDAGYLEVEACVSTHVEQASLHGAVVKTEQTVREWSSDGKRVSVKTDREDYEAAQLIITAGPSAAQVLADLALPLEVVRKPMFWFETKKRAYSVEKGSPAFYCEMPAGAFYGFPSLDNKTVKLAEHTGGSRVDDPLAVDRDVHPDDIQPPSDFVRAVMPGLDPQPVRHSVCLYTLTPDRHFIVDLHPVYRNVAIGAGFSGHGFKFTTVLGQALAELAVDGETDLPIGFLGLGRAALRGEA